jgi:hypothetical protein
MWRRLVNIPDIDKCISLGLGAVQLSPDNDRAAWLNTLGTALFSRFERFGDRIAAREEAVRIAPDNHMCI